MINIKNFILNIVIGIKSSQSLEEIINYKFVVNNNFIDIIACEDVKKEEIQKMIKEAINSL